MVLQAAPPEPDPDFVLVDERFHVVLAEAAGNHAIAEYLQVINERIRVLRMREFFHAGRIEATARQHLALVNAVLEDQPEPAVELMTAHLDEALDHASALTSVAIERMMTAGALVNSRAQEPRQRGHSKPLCSERTV